MVRVIVFDFDGVLVESGEVKTEAFAHLFKAEPAEVVARVVRYHEQHGGICRFEKFRVIYREILQRPLSEEAFRRLCEAFSGLVVDEIVAAPWVPGAEEFLRRHRQGRYTFFIVSGTPQQELREIIRRRGMAHFFAEVLGAPETKARLLSGLLRRHAFRRHEVVFVGDAQTDWLAARQCGVRFVRRMSGPSSAFSGFAGPTISSLMELEECLAGLAGAEASPAHAS